MARTSASHADDPGSNPGDRTINYCFFDWSKEIFFDWSNQLLIIRFYAGGVGFEPTNLKASPLLLRQFLALNLNVSSNLSARAGFVHFQERALAL